MASRVESRTSDSPRKFGVEKTGIKHNRATFRQTETTFLPRRKRVSKRVSRVPAYEYKKIEDDQIRLLTLSLSCVAEHPDGALKVVSLAEKPRYIALSYNWGNEPAALPILIRDKRPSLL